jgi:uncharacterized delta-60 repeat protein
MSKHNKSVDFSRRVLTCLGCVVVAASTLLVVPVTLPRQMQSHDGTPDAAFGTAGVVRTDFSGQFDNMGGLAIQPDGKIIVAGATGDASGRSIALVRYNRDGSLDASFGSGGKTFSKAGRIEGVTSIVLLPDGKILVAGVGFGNGQDFAVARFNGDGTVDTSFGNGGGVINDFGSAEIAFDMKVQPDGKILLAGSAGRPNLQASSYAVLRYKSQGVLDKLFGNRGKASVDFSGGFDDALAMALQPDGKIVLVGGTDFNSRTSPWGLACFNSNGSLDAGFGNGGKVTTGFLGFQSEAHAVVIQPDGKIVVAGRAEQAHSPINLPDVLAIARYNSDGSLDMTFGSGGKATYDFFGRGGSALALVLQRDGKILVAGEVGNVRAGVPKVDFALVRYNKDGSLDSSFGDGAVVMTDAGDVIDTANAVALQPDGKIVLGGDSGDEESHSDIALARYNNDSQAFDSCIQDDSNGNLLQFNSATGDYKFTACATGLTLAGKAVIKVKGCKTKINVAAADHNLTVLIKTCKGNATATVTMPATMQTFIISDSHTADNDCACH